MTVSEPLVYASNGRMVEAQPGQDGRPFHRRVSTPIHTLRQPKLPTLARRVKKDALPLQWKR